MKTPIILAALVGLLATAPATALAVPEAPVDYEALLALSPGDEPAAEALDGGPGDEGESVDVEACAAGERLGVAIPCIFYVRWVLYYFHGHYFICKEIWQETNGKKGLQTHGLDLNHDGDFNDPGEYPPDKLVWRHCWEIRFPIDAPAFPALPSPIAP